MKHLLILLLLTIFLVSCEKNPNYDDDGIPNKVGEFLSKSEIKSLENIGVPIYRGEFAPTINGTYIMDSLEIFYDDLGQTLTVEDQEYTFEEQNNDTGEINFSSTLGVTKVSYISGNTNCFTIYSSSTSTGADCDTEMPDIISGCIIDGNIINFKHAFVLTKRVGTCTDIIEIGHRRVLQEKDGVAQKKE